MPRHVLRIGRSNAKGSWRGRHLSGHRSPDLDSVTFSENDRLVRDIRLPGDGDKRTKEWRCDICGQTRWSSRPQVCSRCHVPMTPQ
jgi:hypothetical protein